MQFKSRCGHFLVDENHTFFKSNSFPIFISLALHVLVAVGACPESIFDGLSNAKKFGTQLVVVGEDQLLVNSKSANSHFARYDRLNDRLSLLRMQRWKALDTANTPTFSYNSTDAP